MHSEMVVRLILSHLWRVGWRRLTSMSNLLPAAIAATLPALTPDSSWTWYLTEFDHSQQLCFGLVIGLDHELGYFSLAELEEVRGPLGLAIERDFYFKPSP